MGLEPFRHLVNDPRFAQVPMYLETAKEVEDGEEMDVVNLRVLRGLIEGQAGGGRPEAGGHGGTSPKKAAAPAKQAKKSKTK